MGTTKFKIYSLLLVKNEADIIQASLIDACRWSDKIIVIDNGSTDGTWEIIQSLANENTKIIPWLRYEGAFHIGLRALAFNAFKYEMRWGDWWCVRLDADEFFVGDVREMLSKVPWWSPVVKKESTDFVLTQTDIDNHDFSQPFEQNLPYFIHSLPQKRRERRFVRHNPFLFWNKRWRYPHPLGTVAEQVLPVNHYQYRSIEQMQKRFLTRRQARQDGCGSFKHENGNSWENYLHLLD
ncbi:MAG: glycosyltransferase family 2 protein [Paludibacteraceae bacterium]|nr:glycosyltransferase family 2 protein [Paludibacteraceae bacterium]